MTSPTETPIPIEERLIVALDLPTLDAARAVIDALGETGRFYKIGYQLMPVGGIELARSLLESGRRVFLDFKYHDIPATVAKGAASAARLGGDILTVHSAPGVVAAAVEGRGDDPRLKIFAVTVLTSLSQADLAAEGIAGPIEALVLRRAEAAARAGADGVIASPQEAPAIRARFGPSLAIVTPGVRPQGAALDDQSRVATPAEAIRAGADRIVVGRPITAAASPVEAARAIIADMARATG